MKKRINIVYSGAVQGVGFRFTVERIAAALGIKGWVRNVPDGSVEVTAEGEEKDLVIFIDRIKSSMKHYIRRTNVDWQDCMNEFDSFSIKFY